MKFIRNTILLSIVSFGIVTFNIGAASETYLDISFGGLSGYTTGVKSKTYYKETIQRMETLRADDKIIATLYRYVGGGTEKVKVLNVDKKSNPLNGPAVFIHQSFGNDSKYLGDYKLNLKKSSAFGTTRYWGNWVYDIL